jgi:hypothetical protein
MGLFVARAPDAAPPLQNAGELTLGGLNPALYEGEMTYLPVHKDHWALAFTYLGLDIKPIMVNGTYADNNTYNAAEGVTAHRRDLGAGPAAALWFGEGSLLAPDLSDALLAGIPGSSRVTTGNSTTYTVPCETNATLIFTVSGYNFTMAPSDWIYPVPSTEGACAAYFKPIEEDARAKFGYGPDTLVVFGLNALRTVYTAFRPGNGTEPPQLGFAPLSEAARGVVPTPVGNESAPIPGASEGVLVTGTGAGVGASAPAGGKSSASLGAATSVGGVLLAAVLAVVAM